MYKKSFRGKRFARRGARKAGARKGRRGSASVSMATKRYINRIIHKNIETKCFNGIVNNQNISPALSSVPYYVKVTPDSILQGVRQQDRVGNEIRIMSAHYKGQVNLKPYDALSNPSNVPVNVVMYLCKYKLNNDQPDFTKFFQFGASSSGFNNAPSDLWQTVNKDLWRVCSKRMFRLGFNGNGGAIGVPSYTNTADGSSKFNQFFNIPLTKWLKKVQKYNDTTATVTNDNLYLVVHPVQADGGNIDVTPIEWHYEYEYKYEDA